MALKESIRRSLLWSTYGDALGFVGELCTKSTFKKRVNGRNRITNLLSWSRRVGGRNGVHVELPIGCYSDDTQLRLATCRSLVGHGTFDADTFAKIELPIWLSYQLGGGRSTKAGADSLKKNEVSWNSNFYHSEDIQYINAGGNGAAMRIQPHVWCAQNEKKGLSILRDVIRNTIITHGHCRAIVGAAFHAMCLRHATIVREIPGPNEWFNLLKFIWKIPDVIAADAELNLIWLPTWERVTKKTIEEGISETVIELRQDIELATEMLDSAERLEEPKRTYPSLVNKIGGSEKRQVGSGVKTTVLAAFLGYIFRDRPHEGIVEAANLIGTDTDTIATMAGALLGITADEDPPEQVVDVDYLERVSDRLYRQSLGQNPENHPYPDLLQWQSPKAQVDAIGIYDGRLSLRGFGIIEPIEHPIQQCGKTPCLWQWAKLDFGQTVLTKRRQSPTQIGTNSLPAHLPISSHNPTDEISAREIEKRANEQEQIEFNADTGEQTGVKSSAIRKQTLKLSSQSELKTELLRRISRIENEIDDLKEIVKRKL